MIFSNNIFTVKPRCEYCDFYFESVQYYEQLILFEFTYFCMNVIYEYTNEKKNW